MIINGGSRSGGAFFARHLMRADQNERVSVVEIRGLAAQNVRDAFREMEAVASGTRCMNYFYHANLNAREDEHLTPEQWEQAADVLERELGLTGQPRFIVEHEKAGRTHRHVVWSRIDADSMTALSDSLTYRKHELAAREIEREFGLEPVESVLVKDRDGERPERRPKDWESFRGRDSNIDPHAMKAEITALWQAADTGLSFKAALEEAGYILAKGDKRDFCIIDPAGDEHSLARRISGAKAAEIRTRMSDVDQAALPTVEEARELARDAADSADAAGAPAGTMGQVEPETSPPAEQELPDRFKDFALEKPGDLRAGEEPSRPGEILAAAASDGSTARGGLSDTPERVSPWGEAWRVFADHAAAFADHLYEFLKDETSGTLEAERGFAARVFDAGRKLWSGWHHDNEKELAEGIGQAARLALEFVPEKPDGEPKTFADRVADRARALLHNERGSIPGDDFDRMAAEWMPEEPAEEPGTDTAEPSAEPALERPDYNELEID